LRRFDAEARALEKSHHPAIVRYIAHGVAEEGRPYLAMEWVDGETLCARLRRGPLALREVLTLGQRIAEGLEAAHALGIVHRDIKPSNVMLPGRDIAQAKIADFGLARPMGAVVVVDEMLGANGTSVSARRATATGTIVGTPGYMAPEQAHGMPDLDGRADLFSLGCLLFRCLTDTEAFEGSRALTALAKLVLLSPMRVRELRPEVPAALDDLVDRLLSKERECRPASAAEVCGVLAAIEAPSGEAKVQEVLASLEPGTSFGRYLLEGRLGAGGMGELFRAHDTVLGRSVALKLLRRSPDAETSALLVREARVAATLSHPNIVTIYDAGEHEGVPYVAMECISGDTLRALMGRPREAAEQVSWLIEIARGLVAAHRAGVVHGDVKPENVMVTGDGAVKLLDFGLAAAVPGSIMGTPAYMAPEQIRGEAIDGRADQFAWGVVAYELLTGGTPWFRSDDPAAILGSVLVQVPDFELLEAELSNAAIGGFRARKVASVVRRALSKASEDRFASMDALLSDLEAGAMRAVTLHLPPSRRSGSRSLGRLAWSTLVLLAAGLGVYFGRPLVNAPAANGCPANVFCLWDNIGFKGKRVEFTVDVSDLRSYDFNDAASSMINNTERVVNMYSDINYSKLCYQASPHSVDKTLVNDHCDGVVSSIKFQ
ncbi:MAG TPA: serine/threonine-protein kinase, partial [Polyangiaceae bacterium]|nr:serine/threonine-protein kinase [Polyangiaceae bacterium]